MTPEEHIAKAESLLKTAEGAYGPEWAQAYAMQANAHVKIAKFKSLNINPDANPNTNYDSWDM